MLRVVFLLTALLAVMVGTAIVLPPRTSAQCIVECDPPCCEGDYRFCDLGVGCEQLFCSSCSGTLCCNCSMHCTWICGGQRVRSTYQCDPAFGPDCPI